jgi:hypothetical protein
MNWKRISTLSWHDLLYSNYDFMDPRQKNKVSTRVVIISLTGQKVTLFFWLDFPSHYRPKNTPRVRSIISNCNWEFLTYYQQLSREYKCKHPTPTLYHTMSTNLIKRFYDFFLVRENNT